MFTPANADADADESDELDRISFFLLVDIFISDNCCFISCNASSLSKFISLNRS